MKEHHSSEKRKIIPLLSGSAELQTLTHMIHTDHLEIMAQNTYSATTCAQIAKISGPASAQEAARAVFHNIHLNDQIAGHKLDVWDDETAKMTINHTHKAAASISALLRETNQHELLLRALL